MITSIILLIIIVVLAVGGPVWAYHMDKKEWNNGGCPYCEKGWWEVFDVDSASCRGFKCTNCGERYWETGWYHTVKEAKEKGWSSLVKVKTAFPLNFFFKEDSVI